ncbi:hypothetical protein B0H10DRAFT_1955757 [Mycena sp. CBHHK59/15]|nr:hypothetical protein B0H10DRAFT_1955757 [Mycena sp. CBHHK59/15]
MQDKISKALKTCSKAIRCAIIVYNNAAALLTPLWQHLTFAKVIQMISLAEFDILHDTRQDIRLLSWTQPAPREAMVLHFGIKRAKEEVRRLNVEITRLLAYLVDKHINYYRAITANIINSSGAGTKLSHQRSICQTHVQTSRLVGFSGTIFPDQREDRDPTLGNGIPPPYWLATELRIVLMEVEYDEGADPNPAQTTDDDSEWL